MSSAVPKIAAPLERLRSLATARLPEAAAMRKVKTAALEQFLAQGFPTQRDEDWKYTSLKRLESRAFEVAASAPISAQDVDRQAIAAPGWLRVVFVNGHFTPALSSPVGPLSSRPSSHDSIHMMGALATTSPDRAAALLEGEPAALPSSLTALNTAFTDDGLTLELADGVNLAEPIYCLFIWTAPTTPVMTHPRIIVRLGRGARARLIEHYVGAEDPRTESFTNAVTQVHLGAGARLDHYRLQEEGARSFHLGATFADLQRDANFISHSFAFGASLSRVSTDVYLREAGAHTALRGLFFAAGTSHSDVHTRIEHLAPRTQSLQNFRGIAAERGRGVFNGKIRVAQDAQKIAAEQSSRNLLLGPLCEIDTKPELEIYADDVKCSHGATTGQLDLAALFYLRSRGIEEHDARSMLTEAFAASVLATLELPPLRDHLGNILRRRLARTEDRK